MTRIHCVCVLMILLPVPLQAQQKLMDQDPNLSSLVHARDYETRALGTLGRVTNVGQKDAVATTKRSKRFVASRLHRRGRGSHRRTA